MEQLFKVVGTKTALARVRDPNPLIFKKSLVDVPLCILEPPLQY
jgi:hypothetical protein